MSSSGSNQTSLSGDGSSNSRERRLTRSIQSPITKANSILGSDVANFSKAMYDINPLTADKKKWEAVKNIIEGYQYQFDRLL